jgi:hypothetical protein
MSRPSCSASLGATICRCREAPPTDPPPTATAPCENRNVTFDEATSRLVELARASGGTISNTMVEQDAELSANRAIVSAAAHALSGSTNVFTSPASGGWFPYAEIRFTDLR